MVSRRMQEVHSESLPWRREMNIALWYRYGTAAAAPAEILCYTTVVME